MGLRLREGVDLDYFQARTGYSLTQAVDEAFLAACIEEGYLEQTSNRLCATREGRLRLDALLPRLLN